MCGAIADRYGLLTTFYFPVATIIVANIFIAPVDPEPRYAPSPAE